MKSKTHIMGIVLTVALYACSSNHNTNMNNPFQASFNDAFAFDQLSSESIIQASQDVVKQMDNGLQEIFAIKKELQKFENSLLVMDGLFDRLNSVHSIIYLMAFTHPDSTIRSTCEEQMSVLNKYSNALSLNENIYQTFKNIATSTSFNSLAENEKRMVVKNIESFERNGFNLPEGKRKELKILRDELSDVAQNFSSNITTYDDQLIVSEEEIAGLPDDYKSERKQEDGSYKIDMSYPSYRPFMQYSKNEKARKLLMIKFLNRAADSNLEVLDQLLQLRLKLAKMLGFETFAQYQLVNKMAKNPQTVWDFEERLKTKLRVKADKDYEELWAVKKAVGQQDSLKSWESSFYNNLLLEQKYQLDQEELKQYFSLDNSLEGVFNVAQILFDFEFKEIKDVPVWHKDVQVFEVLEKGKVVGRFYLDLFPRDNKYNHAACFSFINGVNGAHLNQIPSAALVCNFPSSTGDKPSLLTHNDVVTLFHEFGHLLHHLIAVQPLSEHAGISNSRDFVELPSQIFENWAWDYKSLAMFAKHYTTGEVLPKVLYEKMVASKNVGSGIDHLQQVFYGTVDMTLHDKYIPGQDQSTTEVVKQLQNETTLYNYLDGTHFEASFGHLNGYGSGYYGYLWSKVYAEDCFAKFQKEGILNKDLGLKFKKEILSRGSSLEDMSLIESFLGRQPNEEAFLKSIGL